MSAMASTFPKAAVPLSCPKRSSGNDNDGHACDRQNDAQRCEPSNFSLVHGSAGEVHGAEQQGRAEKHAYLIFSDYLIWCYAWAICCSDGPNRGKIALIGGLPDAIVAGSFRQFLLLELTDDLSIHQGARGASRTRN